MYTIGGRTAETIVAWVGKKSGPLTTTLSNMEEVDAFLAPVKVQYLYVTWVGKKSEPLTTTLSNMEEVDAFLAPVKVQYLYVTWVGKKSGPLTTTLSNMEEVDAFLAPVKVQYLCNMDGQVIRIDWTGIILARLNLSPSIWSAVKTHCVLCLQVAVIGFFKNMESAEAQAFAKAAEAVDDQV